MRRLQGATSALSIMLLIQFLTGCAWVENDPIEMKLAGPTGQITPCVAAGLSKEFRDTLPVVDRGNLPGSHEITVNAPRGGMLAFVTVDPIPTGGSQVTIYNGLLYWPRRDTGGVFPDVMRDNWHRAERAVLSCSKPAA